MYAPPRPQPILLSLPCPPTFHSAFIRIILVRIHRFLSTILNFYLHLSPPLYPILAPHRRVMYVVYPKSLVADTMI